MWLGAWLGGHEYRSAGMWLGAWLGVWLGGHEYKSAGVWLGVARGVARRA